MLSVTPPWKCSLILLMSYLSFTHSSIRSFFPHYFSLFSNSITFYPLLKLSCAVSCQSWSGLSSETQYVRIMIAMRLIFSIFIHVQKIFFREFLLSGIFILDCQGMKKGLFLISIMSFSFTYFFPLFSPKNHRLKDFSIL